MIEGPLRLGLTVRALTLLSFLTSSLHLIIIALIFTVMVDVIDDYRYHRLGPLPSSWAEKVASCNNS